MWRVRKVKYLISSGTRDTCTACDLAGETRIVLYSQLSGSRLTVSKTPNLRQKRSSEGRGHKTVNGRNAWGKEGERHSRWRRPVQAGKLQVRG